MLIIANMGNFVVDLKVVLDYVYNNGIDRFFLKLIERL